MDKDLNFNTRKTKGIAIDFRNNTRTDHVGLCNNGEEVEPVASFKFLGVHIFEDLTYCTSYLVERAHQHVFSSGFLGAKTSSINEVTFLPSYNRGYSDILLHSLVL